MGDTDDRKKDDLAPTIRAWFQAVVILIFAGVLIGHGALAVAQVEWDPPYLVLILLAVTGFGSDPMRVWDAMRGKQ